MLNFVLTERYRGVGTITLNRPEVLNAWHRTMRNQLVAAFDAFEADDTVRGIVLTGAGDRAFGAGQDLNETKSFDANRAEEWVGEWERLYDCIRSLSKPLVAALNGIAAGSAFQVALLADFRIGHPGVRMGQPEINAGITSTTGPWIMREMIGLARTIELTLSGRFMSAEECHSLGLINRIVPQDRVRAEALSLAEELAAKPPVAMRLNKQRLREMTEAGFHDALDAGIRLQRESYKSGEPARMMERFLEQRAAAKRA
ncbi:MAG: enoyl-CoA hydratase/isomerase family protein [Rhodospirillales bacterium]|nr:enoyl-CoA hydratase/isomerase family protein [Rhodospirillales bacterium]